MIDDRAPGLLVGLGFLGALLGGCMAISQVDSGQASGGAGGALSGTGGYWTGPQSKTDKVDLLLVVDDSLGTGDAQALFRQAAPKLVTRLVAPNCVDSSGVAVAASGPDACPPGASLELAPVTSLHVGIVTSSMGGAGLPCVPGGTTNPRENRRGHLVGPNLDMDSADAVITFDRGSDDPAALAEAVSGRLALLGEQGCGFEAPHEAWYRFLVDPMPPASVVVDPDTNLTTAQGIDDVLLAQRSSFLRPDSAVVIVVLSDENDCSIIDHGQGWMAASGGRLPRSTSACNINPNDPCCFSCTLSPQQAPTSCPGPRGGADPDSECTQDALEGYGPGFLSAVEDCACLRCWQSKRRFGFDLLFPVQRYIDGLSRTVIESRELDSNGKPSSQPNPLLSDARDPSLLTLVGIVGVPWQDLATDPTLDANVHALEFRDHASLAEAGRWDVVLGTPEATPPIPPTDPFMLESIDPRSGSNPVTGQPIVDASSTDPRATINGHEYNAEPSMRIGLQYACTYELPAAMQRDCTLEEYTTQDPDRRKGCDCKPGTESMNRPVCAGNVQVFGKSCPGTRHLELLEGLGPRGVVTSVCPKFSSGSGADDPSYGYEPVVAAAVKRLRPMIE